MNCEHYQTLVLNREIDRFVCTVCDELKFPNRLVKSLQAEIKELKDKLNLPKEEGPNMKRLKEWLTKEEENGLKSIHLSINSLEGATAETIAEDILNLLEAPEVPITDID